MLNFFSPSFGLPNFYFSVVFGTLPLNWMQTSKQREGLAELHARACMAPQRHSDRKLGRRFCVRLARKSSTVIGYIVNFDPWWAVPSHALTCIVKRKRFALARRAGWQEFCWALHRTVLPARPVLQSPGCSPSSSSGPDAARLAPDFCLWVWTGCWATNHINRSWLLAAKLPLSWGCCCFAEAAGGVNFQCKLT